jgi:hypothetical protein
MAASAICATARRRGVVNAWFSGILAFMRPWLKMALMVLGLCAGWMVVGLLTVDDDDEFRQVISAYKPR